MDIGVEFGQVWPVVAFGLGAVLTRWDSSRERKREDERRRKEFTRETLLEAQDLLPTFFLAATRSLNDSPLPVDGRDAVEVYTMTKFRMKVLASRFHDLALRGEVEAFIADVEQVHLDQSHNRLSASYYTELVDAEQTLLDSLGRHLSGNRTIWTPLEEGC